MPSTRIRSVGSAAYNHPAHGMHGQGPRRRSPNSRSHRRPRHPHAYLPPAHPNSANISMQAASSASPASGASADGNP